MDSFLDAEGRFILRRTIRVNKDRSISVEGTVMDLCQGVCFEAALEKEFVLAGEESKE